MLAFLPTFVQRAGGTRATGTIVHDAAGDTGRPLGRFHSIAEGYLPGRAGKRKLGFREHFF